MTNDVRSAFNMACPKCGRDDDIRIYMHTWAVLGPDGTDANDSEHIWDEHDDCACGMCGHHARVAEFMLESSDKGVVKPERRGEVVP